MTLNDTKNQSLVTARIIGTLILIPTIAMMFLVVIVMATKTTVGMKTMIMIRNEILVKVPAVRKEAMNRVRVQSCAIEDVTNVQVQALMSGVGQFTIEMTMAAVTMKKIVVMTMSHPIVGAVQILAVPGIGVNGSHLQVLTLI